MRMNFLGTITRRRMRTRQRKREERVGEERERQRKREGEEKRRRRDREREKKKEREKKERDRKRERENGENERERKRKKRERKREVSKKRNLPFQNNRQLDFSTFTGSLFAFFPENRSVWQLHSDGINLNTLRLEGISFSMPRRNKKQR